MDRVKTGKFIQKLRKGKNMTQQELAEILGVADRTIGNWENGRNIPDLSMLKPLCDILGVSVNDLISGEIISDGKHQEKYEDNIVYTINYSVERINKYNRLVGFLLIVLGLLIATSSVSIFSFHTTWKAINIAIGVAIFVIGVSHLVYRMKLCKRILLILLTFLCAMSIYVLNDYFRIKNHNSVPAFWSSHNHVNENVTYYKTLFYGVIECDGKGNIVKNKKYTNDELINYCQNK